MKYIKYFSIKKNLDNTISFVLALDKQYMEDFSLISEEKHPLNLLKEQFLSAKLLEKTDFSNDLLTARGNMLNENNLHCHLSYFGLSEDNIELRLKKQNKSFISLVSSLFENLSIREIDENPKGHQFYTTFGGNQILKSKNFPDGIKNFLESELAYFGNFLSKNAGAYDAIFEVGCGKARHLDLAIHNNLNYYGIDFVAHDIVKAQEKISSVKMQKQMIVRCMSVFDFNEKTNFIPVNERVLCIFPFNALGNMGNIFKILKNFRKFNFDILVSSYRTDDKATGIRQAYFENCGYHALQCDATTSGVVFSSEEGLQSVAFNKAYLTDICQAAKFDMVSGEFGEIGMMYRLRCIRKEQKLFSVPSFDSVERDNPKMNEITLMKENYSVNKRDF